VFDWQIKGGPGWIDSQKWDIEARAGKSVASVRKRFDPSAPDPILLMPQSLLEDRFQLKIMHQTKTSSVYNLVIAKGGPKIKLDDDLSPPVPRGSGATFPKFGEWPRGSIGGGSSSIEARAVSIETFIDFIRARADRPMIDRTNLKGLYNIRTKWSLEDSVLKTDPSLSAAGMTTDAPPALSLPPSFLTALREQLGLRLVSAKGPVDFLYIVGVQRPSEN
jgi:uncharacterized protein (TIGR03435 family)